jgi:hypothetical protein
VDCFRYRNKIGIDIAMEGLREGIRRRKCTPDQLWQYAKAAHVWAIMQPYVEAVTDKCRVNYATSALRCGPARLSERSDTA